MAGLHSTLEARTLTTATAPSEAWPHRRRDLAVLAVVATAMHGFVYLLANHYPLGVARRLPLSAVDLAVPFWPWTVFVYLSDYLLLFTAFLCCRTRASADRFLLAQFFVISIATLTHWSYPVAFPRERYPLPGDLAALPALAMGFLREVDAETSCLPSLHVAAALLAPLMISRQAPRAFPWLLAWAVLVSGSTLTTKQHYAVDVLAGAILALATSLGANTLRSTGAGPPSVGPNEE